MADTERQHADDVAERMLPYAIICDALTLAYGTDGEPGIEYWTEGAALAVTSLIEAGWLPPEADPAAHIDGSEGA